MRDATDPDRDLIAIDTEQGELGMRQARLQRSDKLRKRQAAQVGEILHRMNQHRRWPLHHVFADDEGKNIEQRLPIGIRKCFANVGR